MVSGQLNQLLKRHVVLKAELSLKQIQSVRNQTLDFEGGEISNNSKRPWHSHRVPS